MESKDVAHNQVMSALSWCHTASGWCRRKRYTTAAGTHLSAKTTYNVVRNCRVCLLEDRARGINLILSFQHTWTSNDC
jgi:hypothetical protein